VNATTPLSKSLLSASSHYPDLYSIGRGQREFFGLPWQTGAGGRIIGNYKNALLAIQVLDIKFRRDVFSDRITVCNGREKVLLAAHEGFLSDNGLTYLRKHIQSRFDFDATMQHLLDAGKALAEENLCNPVVDWLESLKWDGKRRLKSWLVDICGTEATHLTAVTGAMLIRAMTVRAYHPGTKFDYCVVFEGAQGAGKSSLARALASGPSGDDYFLDSPGLIGMSNKERAELLAGKWVVELSELAGLQRNEVESTKAFISQSIDTYRAPYARTTQDRPRTCVLLGTTNSAGYLNDITGNRRFLPVKCGIMDLAAFKRIRAQLFGEAVASLKRIYSGKVGACVVGRPLPNDLASAYLSVPTGLRSQAQSHVESRVGTSALEEAVIAAIKLAPKENLADGRSFLSSGDLLTYIRLQLPNVSGTGISTHMAAQGWDNIREGSGAARRRGYVQRQGSGR
jgi:hypothetical protein